MALTSGKLPQFPHNVDDPLWPAQIRRADFVEVAAQDNEYTDGAFTQRFDERRCAGLVLIP